MSPCRLAHSEAPLCRGTAMRNIRRFTALFAVAFIGVTITAFLGSQSAGQPLGKKVAATQPTPPASTGSAANFSSIKIIEDTRFRQIINVGRDCIKDKEWKQA